MIIQPTLGIDMDFFCYRAASASEDEIEYNSDLTLVIGSLSNGQRIIRQQIKDLRDRFDTDKLVLFFTDITNFRKDIDPSYKGNRTKRKPAGYARLKRWCMAEWDAVVLPGLEADDALGIAATSGEYQNFVIVSPDKDMLQIPGRIYDLKTEFTQTATAAERKLYEQTLTGDSTDGYRGCPGIGPAKCGAILDTPLPDQSSPEDREGRGEGRTDGKGRREKGGRRNADDGRKAESGRGCTGVDYWPRVTAAYEKAGQSASDALRNARLAKILHASDWDSEAQKPILFEPPCA